MKSTQPSGWLRPVQIKGKWLAGGAAYGTEIVQVPVPVLRILLYLGSWCSLLELEEFQAKNEAVFLALFGSGAED